MAFKLAFKIELSQGSRYFILRINLHQRLNFPLLYLMIRLLGKKLVHKFPKDNIKFCIFYNGCGSMATYWGQVKVYPKLDGLTFKIGHFDSRQNGTFSRLSSQILCEHVPMSIYIRCPCMDSIGSDFCGTPGFWIYD